MYNKDRLMKKYEDKSFKELVKAPVSALQGLSEKDAQLLDKAFHVKTIKDLANLKFAHWAREIIELADAGIKSYNFEDFEDKLMKKYEKKSPGVLAKAPLDALQGLSKNDAVLLQKAFDLKNIRDLAELKYFHWAEEIVTSAMNAPARDVKKGKGMSLVAKIFIAACLFILLVVIMKRFVPHFKYDLTSISKTQDTKVDFGSQVEIIEDEKEKKEVKKKVRISDVDSDIYIVQENDELRFISEKKYNDSKKWKKIYEANRDVIEHPDKIYPGQKLKIPQ